MTSPATPTTPVEDLVIGLYRLSLVQREMAKHALAELGSQGFAALGVVATGGPLRVSDIAERLGVDLSVASRQVAALEAAGHVGREPDPGDRRAHRISVTEAGRCALRESHRRMVAAVAARVADWDEQEVTALARRLDRLREAFTTGAGAPTPEEVAAP